MSKIRKSAKGEECTLRLIGICNGNSETTVFCHIGKIRGMGIKCSDNFGVYGCSACHRVIDGQDKDNGMNPNLDADKLRGLEETQLKLIEKGLLVIK